MGHKLHADVAIAVDPALPLAEAHAIAKAVEEELSEHTPALAFANVRLTMPEVGSAPIFKTDNGHHHAPEPVQIRTLLASGVLEIVDTPEGERMRLTTQQVAPGLAVKVVIARPQSPETLELVSARDPKIFQSTMAPAEPHEFQAELLLTQNGESTRFPFAMEEPAGHHH